MKIASKIHLKLVSREYLVLSIFEKQNFLNKNEKKINFLENWQLAFHNCCVFEIFRQFTAINGKTNQNLRSETYPTVVDRRTFSRKKVDENKNKNIHRTGKTNTFLVSL